MEIKNARIEDAKALAYLINLAGEGLPEYLWKGMIEGNESPIDVGARRAARDEGAFSYTNARICVEDDALLGMIISYRLPDPYEIVDINEYPDLIRPLVKLEAEVAGSWYINAIATYEQYRGKGVARTLIADTETGTRSAGCDLMSLIVDSENAEAIRLYERLDFKAVKTLPIIPYQGRQHGGEWVLMIKHLTNV